MSGSLICQGEPMAARTTTHQRTAYLIKRVQAAVHAELEQRLAHHNLSFTQWGVLAALMEFPGMSNAALARFAFMTPQSMNQAVKQLETAGLVERQPNSANGRDRKSTRLNSSHT